MRMRLATRIALAVGAIAALLVLAAGWLLLSLVARDLQERQDAELRRRAVPLAANAQALLRASAFGRPEAVERNRERRLYASAQDIGFRLVGPQGELASGPRPDEQVVLPTRVPSLSTVTTAEGDWRVLAVPVSVRATGSRATLWLFAPDSANRAQFQLVRKRVVSVALLAAPLAGALAWGATRRAVLPLRRLQERAGGLDPGRNAARLDHTPTRITEVDELAHTLQTVLARYDEQVARTGEALATARAFSAAASHELRTPLMSMRTNLDILAEHPGLDAPERAEVVEDLRAEHQRLIGLLMMLRALAQGDLVGQEALDEVDLVDLVDASVSQARGGRPDASITVRCGTPAVRVHGWEPGLRSLVDNLLANALTHGRTAEEPARVTVTVDASGGRDALLIVDDEGPGIPPEERQTVFERFRRGKGSPGSGLGLTLVAQQVALHGGRIRILDSPRGRGTRFEVRLPAGSSPEAPTLVLPARRDWLSSSWAGSQDSHKNDA